MMASDSPVAPAATSMAADATAAMSAEHACHWTGCQKVFQYLENLVVHLEDEHVSSSALAAVEPGGVRYLPRLARIAFSDVALF